MSKFKVGDKVVYEGSLSPGTEFFIQGAPDYHIKGYAVVEKLTGGGKRICFQDSDYEYFADHFNHYQEEQTDQLESPQSEQDEPTVDTPENDTALVINYGSSVTENDQDSKMSFKLVTPTESTIKHYVCSEDDSWFMHLQNFVSFLEASGYAAVKERVVVVSDFLSKYGVEDSGWHGEVITSKQLKKITKEG